MAEHGPIRVLIVDDHQVVRQGLRTFLELQDDIEVVGEAGDGRAAVELAARLEPDVVLMDIVMPRLDGIEATRRIKEHAPGVGVIALTSFAGDDQVLPALEAGASSYLLKDVSPEELVEAIRAVHRGEPRLHPDALRKVMEAATGPRARRGARPRAPSPPDDLTERELEVVPLVAQGRSNREIAETFVISEKTVKTHIGHILAKLELKDRTQLAIYAIRHGLAGDDQEPGGRGAGAAGRAMAPEPSERGVAAGSGSPRAVGVVAMLVVWAAVLARTLGLAGRQRVAVGTSPGFSLFLVILLLVVLAAAAPGRRCCTWPSAVQAAIVLVLLAIDPDLDFVTALFVLAVLPGRGRLHRPRAHRVGRGARGAHRRSRSCWSSGWLRGLALGAACRWPPASCSPCTSVVNRELEEPSAPPSERMVAELQAAQDRLRGVRRPGRRAGRPRAALAGGGASWTQSVARTLAEALDAGARRARPAGRARAGRAPARAPAGADQARRSPRCAASSPSCVPRSPDAAGGRPPHPAARPRTWVAPPQTRGPTRKIRRRVPTRCSSGSMCRPAPRRDDRWRR